MKQVKKTLALAMSALMLLAMLTGCGSSKKDDAPAADSNTETQEPAADTTSSKLDQIKANGKLLVGTEAQYAPYEFKDLDANFARCEVRSGGHRHCRFHQDARACRGDRLQRSV